MGRLDEPLKSKGLLEVDFIIVETMVKEGKAKAQGESACKPGSSRSGS